MKLASVLERRGLASGDVDDRINGVQSILNIVKVDLISVCIRHHFHAADSDLPSDSLHIEIGNFMTILWHCLLFIRVDPV